MLGGQIGQRRARRTYCWILLVVHMTGSTAQVIVRLRGHFQTREAMERQVIEGAELG